METSLENTLKTFHIEGMTSYIETYPEDFGQLVQMAVGGEKHSWRAAWLLCVCMHKNDKRITGLHVEKIINGLPVKKDGHQRELLKVLLKIDLDENYESALFDTCISIWKKTDKQSSVRSTAFKVMVKIAQKYPDLFHEVRILAQNHYMDSLSPGIRQSVLKMMKPR